MCNYKGLENIFYYSYVIGWWGRNYKRYKLWKDYMVKLFYNVFIVYLGFVFKWLRIIYDDVWIVKWER